MSLKRFISAQQHSYEVALKEIKQGRKQSHWMWYIFPQEAGLGHSEMAKRYAIKDADEAAAYLAHPVLGNRLIEISHAVLMINHKSANEIFGSPDDVKLRSCMTLFASAPNADPVFDKVLEKYFG